MTAFLAWALLSQVRNSSTTTVHNVHSQCGVVSINFSLETQKVVNKEEVGLEGRALQYTRYLHVIDPDQVLGKVLVEERFEDFLKSYVPFSTLV